MDMLSWENQIQRHRDLLRKSQSANEHHAVLAAAQAQHDNARPPMLRSITLWLRKRLPTRYNDRQETVPPASTIAQADLPDPCLRAWTHNWLLSKGIFDALTRWSHDAACA